MYKFVCTLVMLFALLNFGSSQVLHKGTEKLVDKDLFPFYHGVASGDPTHSSIILWTRVSPANHGKAVVEWQLSLDPDFSSTEQSGNITTGQESDYVVKIDVRNLKPNTYYYYRFSSLGNHSVTGRTKTAPAQWSEEVQFAVVSCTNYEAGHFNALGRIAEKEDIDAVVHLGDYIYEYEADRYGDKSLDRKHLPPHEIITLEDYRTRYSQYRLDPDLRRVHQMHPFVTIWDDHEIANNSFETGAQNHQSDEGDYAVRKDAARKAYFEWLPIRDQGGGRLYRSISFGNLVDVILLDERLEGRSEQVKSHREPEFSDPSRSMLGAAQLDWFQRQLSDSRAIWKIIGNQVIFSERDSANMWNTRYGMDSWDGYPAEKYRIIEHLKKEDIENVIFISGDTHTSWGMDVPESIAAYKQSRSNTVAVEFGTPSISSSNWDETFPVDKVIASEKRILNNGRNPHIKYLDARNHGYFILRLTEDQAMASYYYVDRIDAPSRMEYLNRKMVVRKGKKNLTVHK